MPALAELYPKSYGYPKPKRELEVEPGVPLPRPPRARIAVPIVKPAPLPAPVPGVTPSAGAGATPQGPASAPALPTPPAPVPGSMDSLAVVAAGNQMDANAPHNVLAASQSPNPMISGPTKDAANIRRDIGTVGAINSGAMDYTQAVRGGMSPQQATGMGLAAPYPQVSAPNNAYGGVPIPSRGGGGGKAVSAHPQPGQRDDETDAQFGQREKDIATSNQLNSVRRPGERAVRPATLELQREQQQHVQATTAAANPPKQIGGGMVSQPKPVLTASQQADIAIIRSAKATEGQRAEAIARMTTSPTGKAFFDRFIDSMFGEGAQPETGSAPAAGQQAQSMPADKSQLVTGGMYQTARGPARWDGSKFVQE